MLNVENALTLEAFFMVSFGFMLPLTEMEERSF